MTSAFLHHAVSARVGDVETDMFHVIYQRGFASWLPPEPASLAFALAAISLWWMLLHPLYRRRIFLEI